MNNEFVIVDGTLYINKDLFRHSLGTDNNLSFLAGDGCSNIFRTKPVIRTGIESVIIDYGSADDVCIPKNLDSFITDITTSYHSNVRGKLTVSTEDKIIDLILHQY